MSDYLEDENTATTFLAQLELTEREIDDILRNTEFGTPIWQK